MKARTRAAGTNLFASEILAGVVLFIYRLCLRCNRESSCCQGFSMTEFRNEPSGPVYR